MRARGSMVAAVLATMLCAGEVSSGLAHDETKYPDWRGQWTA
jgi:hypothetical protein